MNTQLLYAMTAAAALLSPPASGVAQEMRNFKLVSAGEKLQPAGGGPYFLAIFTQSGGAGPGLSANFRSTQFDIAEVASELRDNIVIAIEVDDSYNTTHTISVDAAGLASFFSDKDYLVFPPKRSQVAQYGPFIRMIFHGKTSSTNEKPKPLDGWEIAVSQKDRTVRGKLTSTGVFDVANVTLDPVRCTLKDPANSATYTCVTFPVVRGAVNGLVVYKVWDVGSSF